ncbi:MAG: rhomboid family intramembrane serine protease [Rikenellaceae bacterium]
MINNRFTNSAPPVVLNLIIINCLGLMATTIFPTLSFYLGLHTPQSEYFKLYQVVTYMFLHGGLSHLFFNMFALWMFGRTLENVLGSKRFLIYYMACGVGAGLLQLGIGMVSPYYLTVGASGAVFGLLLAFGVLFPNSIIMLLIPPIPIKAKWFVIIYGVMELMLGIRNSASDNVAHFAHLGGMIWGFLLLLYWRYKNVIRF